MKLLIFAALVFTSVFCKAAVTCNGTINATYKWSDKNSISIQIALDNGEMTNWIQMPSKSDEAMALLALATGKRVQLYWLNADISSCVNGWVHNRMLEGYFTVVR